MKFLFIIALLVVCGTMNAQSIFHSLPPYKAPSNMMARSIVGPTDSLPSIATNKWQGFRFAGPDIMFAIPDFSMWTGLGIDYVWAVANAATQKWDYNYTVGIRVTGGANLGSPTIRTLGGVGARITLLKGYLALGAIYNFTLKKSQAAIGNPAALIPGLN
jgi:hypothetical protein